VLRRIHRGGDDVVDDGDGGTVDGAVDEAALMVRCRTGMAGGRAAAAATARSGAASSLPRLP
jgi:hypothetical protein